jgi:hypothetical protein
MNRDQRALVAIPGPRIDLRNIEALCRKKQGDTYGHCGVGLVVGGSVNRRRLLVGKSIYFTSADCEKFFQGKPRVNYWLNFWYQGTVFKS